MKHDKLGCLHPLILELPEPEHGPAAFPHLLQQQQQRGDEEPEVPAARNTRACPRLPARSISSLQAYR